MIILTGGAGFIGSCLLAELNKKGIDDILVVDNLGTGQKWQNLLGKKFTAYMNKAEFRHQISENPQKFGHAEAIFHLGACTKTTEQDAEYLIDNNFNYSVELANFALEHDIRFIYASSASTYGDGAQGYSDSKFDDLIPLNCYGFSKHIFDLWVLKNGYDKKFTGLKFFNVFGPNEYHKESMASMVFKAFKQVNDTGEIHLFKSSHTEYPDGGQMRDFIYVKDVVKVICKLYEDDKSGIYNLGTGIARSWNDLAAAVFKAFNIVPKIDYIDMPENLIKQYQNYTCADMSKLFKIYPDYTFTTLEDSVMDYITNYLSNNYSRI